MESLKLNADECIDESIVNTLKTLQYHKSIPLVYVTFSSDKTVYVTDPLSSKSKDEFKEKIDWVHRKVGSDWIDVLIFECKFSDGKVIPKSSTSDGSRAAIFIPIEKSGMGLSHIIPFSFDGKGFVFEPEKIIDYAPEMI